MKHSIHVGYHVTRGQYCLDFLSTTDTGEQIANVIWLKGESLAVLEEQIAHAKATMADALKQIKEKSLKKPLKLPQKNYFEDY